jgi:Predicted phosphatases
MKSKKLILFNLGGALLISSDKAVSFWCKAITSVGLRPNYKLIYENFDRPFQAEIIPLLVADGNWTPGQTQAVIENSKKLFKDVHFNSPTDLATKLEALKNAGYELGIITNRCHKTLLRALFDLGISPDIFSIIKTSDDGIKKPDPRVFDSALELFKAEDIIFVGNCPQEDMKAAIFRDPKIDFAAIVSQTYPPQLFKAFGVKEEFIYESIVDFVNDFLKE